MVRILESCLGRPAEIRLLPMQPGDVFETQARVEKLKDLTGYSPRVSIEDGIRRFVDWYLGEYLPLGLTDATQFPLPLPVHTAFQDATSAAAVR
jgi:hypothetical protein